MTEQRGGALVPYILDNAQEAGALSREARRILDRPFNAEALAWSQGIDPSRTDPNSLYVLILADNSPSMKMKKDPRGYMVPAESFDPLSNAATVVICQNKAIEGLLRSANPERILLSTQLLNSPDLNPEHAVIDSYHPLAQAVRLTTENFVVTGGTPLYDRIIQVVGGAIKETQQGDEDYGTPRTATLIITDGRDEYSGQSAEDCREVVESLLRKPRHIIAALGIFDGHTDFEAIFEGIAIPPQWILTADATPEAIAAAINRFTQAAARAASATQEQFLLLTDGGFKVVLQ